MAATSLTKVMTSLPRHSVISVNFLISVNKNTPCILEPKTKQKGLAIPRIGGDLNYKIPSVY